MTPAFARYKNLVAIPTRKGWVGFHAHNMQVAELDQQAHEAFRNATALARPELEEWNAEVDPSAVDADIPQKARSLMVNVAQICNLHCTYCAAGGDGTFGNAKAHLDLEPIYSQIRGVLHDLQNGDDFSLTFFGGEPLVNPDAIQRIARFVRLQTAGRQLNVKFSIITNATLVTEKHAELLASLGCYVTVSLDGAPEVNDRHRVTPSGRGSSDRVLRGLEILKSVRSRLGGISVGSVFGKHNTDVLSAYKYLRTLDFDSYRFDFSIELNDAEASLAYSKSMAETADYAFELGGESELRKIEQFDSYFRALDSQRRLHNHCGAGKSLLTVDARGKLTSCQWFVGRDEEDFGFAEGLDHKKLDAFAERTNVLNDCGSCWARHLCGGGCMHGNYVKNGSKHVKDPVFCARIQSTIAKAIEVYAAARLSNSTHSDPTEA